MRTKVRGWRVADGCGCPGWVHACMRPSSRQRGGEVSVCGEGAEGTDTGRSRAAHVAWPGYWHGGRCFGGGCFGGRRTCSEGHWLLGAGAAMGLVKEAHQGWGRLCLARIHARREGWDGAGGG